MTRLKQRRNTTCVFEILMAVLLTDLGVRFVISPEILLSSNMGILAKSFSADVAALTCFTVGFGRICVLLFEHAFYPWGLHARLGFTVASGFVCGSFLAGFFETFYLQGKALPPGFDMLLTQAVGEFVVALQLSKEIT